MGRMEKIHPKLYFITSNLFRWFKSRSKWKQSRGNSSFAASAAVVHDAHRFRYLISRQKARVFNSSAFFVRRVALWVGRQKVKSNWKELKCMLRMFCALFYGLTETLFVSRDHRMATTHGIGEIALMLLQCWLISRWPWCKLRHWCHYTPPSLRISWIFYICRSESSYIEVGHS